MADAVIGTDGVTSRATMSARRLVWLLASKSRQNAALGSMPVLGRASKAVTPTSISEPVALGAMRVKGISVAANIRLTAELSDVKARIGRQARI